MCDVMPGYAYFVCIVMRLRLGKKLFIIPFYVLRTYFYVVMPICCVICLTQHNPNVVCKVMESIIRDHVMKHFVKNDFFSNKQYGFLKGRSTVLQLLRIIDEWTFNLDAGGQIDCIYIYGF